MDSNEKYIKEIEKLRKEKNAVILAHYYQTSDVQDIADYVGDSLGLAQNAEKCNGDIILFAGVVFMAETAKILTPEKKVLIPDLAAGCSLSDSCKPEDFKIFLEQNPGRTVITYVNTSAEIKAMSDIGAGLLGRKSLEEIPIETLFEATMSAAVASLKSSWTN